MTKRAKKRFNTNFRQTVKEFKSARQAQVYAHLNRNLPHNIFKITKTQFLNNVKKINIKNRKRKKINIAEKRIFKMKKVTKKSQK